MLTGYNAPWLYNNFKDGYPPADLVDKILALKPDVLRFPGGSISFLFDINKPAYGYAMYEGDTRTNYAPAHVRLALSVGALTSYVANLYQAITYGNDDYWVENIVNTVKVLNPKYIELSNELYLYEHITGVKTGDPRWWENKAKFTASVTAAATRYADLSLRVIQAVRAAGYTPEFGVVMDNAAHTRGRVWNATIRAKGGYDFEVFHYYSTRRTADDIYKDLQRNFTGGTKPIAITEYWWDFGFDSLKNPQDVGKSYVEAFEANMATACARDARVFMRLRHQLYGSNPYSKIKI